MDVKTIELTQNKVTIVDACDYDRLIQFKWCAYCDRGIWYAVRGARQSESGPSIVRMHRFILGAPPHLLVDHRDRNGLNNTRGNIRLATHEQNSHNIRNKRSNTSGFKGVCWDKSTRRWKARIRIVGRRIELGYFDTPEEAHASYIAASAKYHGEFGRTA